MMCPSSKSTGIPHLKELRDTQKVLSPGRRKLLIISFRREAGTIESLVRFDVCKSRSWYLERRRKYASSLARVTGAPQSGQQPSTICESVQKDSQGLQ